ncbi:hypothetical protein LCGC14_0414780 [marine sediment metagenome]|uniref:Uncharacterized protein n=1 Tax=marine sediment metagenome TaxID=412755 RepID=A0A0F9W1Y5_9ZZZZ
MARQRIKGQEVEVIAIINGVPQASLSAIRSFSMTYQMEIKSEGYLGEKTNRRDSVFNGIAARMELHTNDPGILTTINSIVDKARRRVPGVVINVKVTLNFPSGRRARVVIPNVEFGDIEVATSSRTDYTTVTMPFEAELASTIG